MHIVPPVARTALNTWYLYGSVVLHPGGVQGRVSKSAPAIQVFAHVFACCFFKPYACPSKVQRTSPGKQLRTSPGERLASVWRAFGERSASVLAPATLKAHLLATGRTLWPPQRATCITWQVAKWHVAASGSQRASPGKWLATCNAHHLASGQVAQAARLSV